MKTKGFQYLTRKMCLEESQRGGAEVKEEMNLIKFNNNFTYFILLLKNSSSLSLSKVEKVKVFHQIKFVPLFFICFRIYFFIFIFISNTWKLSTRWKCFTNFILFSQMSFDFLRMMRKVLFFFFFPNNHKKSLHTTTTTTNKMNKTKFFFLLTSFVFVILHEN